MSLNQQKTQRLKKHSPIQNRTLNVELSCRRNYFTRNLLAARAKIEGLKLSKFHPATGNPIHVFSAEERMELELIITMINEFRSKLPRRRFNLYKEAQEEYGKTYIPVSKLKFTSIQASDPFNTNYLI